MGGCSIWTCSYDVPHPNLWSFQPTLDSSNRQFQHLSWHVFWHILWPCCWWFLCYLSRTAILTFVLAHFLAYLQAYILTYLTTDSWHTSSLTASLAYLLTLILTVHLIYTLTMFDNFLTCILPCAFKAPGPMEERRGGGVSEPKPSDPHLTNVQNDGWFSIRMQKGYINSLKLLPLKFEGLETS